MEKKFIDVHYNLLEACKAGNSKAQFEIYKLYYKAMFNTALQIVNHSAEAEDIMQEAFLTAFEKLDTWSGEVSFGAWLKRIVVNKSIDALRKNSKTELTESLKEPEPEIETSEPDFEAEVSTVKKALQELPEGYKIVVSLYLIEGYDHDEIAEILGITASASRSQLARGKEKLRNLIEQKRTFKK